MSSDHKFRRIHQISIHLTSMSTEKVEVCLLAGSNGSHYNVAVIGQNPKFNLSILTRRPAIFADKVVKGIHDVGGKVVEGKLDRVTDQPEIACKGTKIFIVSSPVSAQEEILRNIKPFVEEGAIIGSVFGQGGFDLIAESVFGDDLKKKNIAIFSLFNIPSTCKVMKPGKEVVIIGPKKYLSVCVNPKSRQEEVRKYCSEMWGVECRNTPNFLNMLMTPGNQIIHTGRLLGLFENGKAHSLPAIPLFYTTLNKLSTDNMEVLSEEIQVIKKAILAKYPKVDLEAVLPLKDRILAQYGSQVKDPTNLFTVFTSNTGYGVMTVPMNKEGDGFVLNTKARTFVEDIPFGLCVLKDLAEKVGFEAPFMTKCIEWHQEMMGKEYVKDGKLNPALIHETGAPSKYGINTLEQLMAKYSN